MKEQPISFGEYAKNAAYLYRRGIVCRENERYMDALRLLKSAYELEPDNETYATDYALCLRMMRSNSESNRVLAGVLETSGTSTESYLDISMNYRDMGETDAARRVWLQYRHMNPSGLTMEDIGLEEMAYRVLSGKQIDRGIRVAKRKERLLHACRTALSRDCTKTAERMAGRVLRYIGREPEALSTLGLCLARRNERSLAKAYTREALAPAKAEPQTLINAMFTYRALGERAQEEAAFERLLQTPMPTRDLYAVLRALLQTDRAAAALKLCRERLGERPYDTHLLDACASCVLYVEGDREEARRLWRKARAVDPLDQPAGEALELLDADDATGAALEGAGLNTTSHGAKIARYCMESMHLPADTLRERWECDPAFRRRLSSALSGREGRYTERLAIRLLAVVPGREAETLLRRELLEARLSNGKRLDILRALEDRGAKMPYSTLTPNGIAHLSADHIPPDTPSNGAYRALDRAIRLLEMEAGDMCDPLWLSWDLLISEGLLSAPCTRPRVTAAALGFLAEEAAALRPSTRSLAKLFECSERSLARYLGRIKSRKKQEELPNATD